MNIKHSLLLFRLQTENVEILQKFEQSQNNLSNAKETIKELKLQLSTISTSFTNESEIAMIAIREQLMQMIAQQEVMKSDNLTMLNNISELER